MKIIVASQNPVKIKAVLNGFKKMFPEKVLEVKGVSVDSNVSAQPQNDLETFTGAKNRVENASKNTKADFWVGIEGGIEEKGSEIECFAWIVIKSKKGKYGKSRTGTFLLPPKITRLIKQGKELAEADDIVFGRNNSGRSNGTIGIMTGNAIDRTKYYTEAVILACIPFKNTSLFK